MREVDMITVFTCVSITHAGKGLLFAWGRGDYGQLGRDIRTDGASSSTATCSPVPTAIPALSRVRQVRDVKYQSMSTERCYLLV